VVALNKVDGVDDTELVDLNVHVLAHSSKDTGRDLQISDFLVREDGHEQEVSLFNKTDAPFDLGIHRQYLDDAEAATIACHGTVGASDGTEQRRALGDVGARRMAEHFSWDSLVRRRIGDYRTALAHVSAGSRQ